MILLAIIAFLVQQVDLEFSLFVALPGIQRISRRFSPKVVRGNSALDRDFRGNFFATRGCLLYSSQSLISFSILRLSTDLRQTFATFFLSKRPIV